MQIISLWPLLFLGNKAKINPCGKVKHWHVSRGWRRAVYHVCRNRHYYGAAA